MRTKVVNLRREAFDVYIGRAGAGYSGTFGNPYAVGKRCTRCSRVHYDRASTLPCFESYFKERIETDPEFKAAVLKLRGRRLGCFCKPLPCHGDIIVKWLKGQP